MYARIHSIQSRRFEVFDLVQESIDRIQVIIEEFKEDLLSPR